MNQIDTVNHCSLSFSQRGIWFDQIHHANRPLYNIGGYVRIAGPVNLEPLEKAVNQVIQENDALRTVFYEGTPLPVQTFAKNIDVQLHFQDFSEQQAPHQQALQWMEKEFATPFQLYGQFLCQFALLKMAEDCYYGFAKYHHLIIDGWGTALVFQRIEQQYQALEAGQLTTKPAGFSYAHFVQDDQQYFKSELYQRHEQHWQQKYRELPEPLIPYRYANQFTGIAPSHRQILTIKWDFYAQLMTFAKDNKVSTFHAILAVLYCYFIRTTGNEDFVIGLPVLNRSSAAFKQTIGLFTGVTPARFNFGTELNLIELMQAIRAELRKDYRQQRFPLQEINKLAGIHKAGRQQLFDITLSYQKHDYLTHFAGYPAKVLTLPNGFEQSALAIAVEEYQDNQDIRLTFDYNLAAYDDVEMERIIARFESLLGEVMDKPTAPIRALNLMPAEERHQVLVEFNNTAASYPRDKTIVDLFEEQVEKTPDNIAVVFEEQQLTYQQLNRRANQLAHYLQTLGVGPEVLVGLCVERSLEMIIGLLGILKAGGAYVPLDPNYPQERLAFMLADSNMPVLLTQHSFVEGQMSPIKERIICLDTDWKRFSDADTSNPVSGVQSNNLAYVIYTSGSTGQPKGVAIEHHSPVVLFNWAKETFTPEQLKGVLASTSICFDLSVFELFVPLCWGGTVILVENALHLSKLSHDHEVTLVNTVPSAIAELLRTDSIPASVQVVNLAGEALKNELVQKLYQYETVQQVFNLYGPSEDTTYSTFTLVEKGAIQSPTIGRPIADTQVYILDQHLNPLPIGVPGELYIGGAGLARGYYNRPEFTTEKFMTDPFSTAPQARLYKTGDLAGYLPDGTIEYMGRIDHQVKIRGFRIELGEIETVLAQHPLIHETAVIIHEEVDATKRLVAYFSTDSSPSSSELRDFLKQKLPSYMIPAFFIARETLPLTPNGKINRQALSQLSIADYPLSEDTFVAPRTPEEELLANIWADILGLERVGTHDNFFELGGDSILNIQIVAKAQQVGLQMTSNAIFEHQTIAELATVVDTGSTHQMAEQGLVIGPVLLTPIHHWFFEQNLSEPHHYNQAVLLEGPSNLNSSWLEQIVQQLQKHHDALRLRFTKEQSIWQATQIEPEEHIAFQVIDLSELSENNQRSALEASINQQQTSLDFAEGPLLRVVLFLLGPEQSSRLLIVIHHLAIDGVSWRVLLEDLQTAYHQLSHGQTIQWPPKTTSFQTWSERLMEYAESPAIVAELEHWLSHIEMTPLPTDKSSPENEKPFVNNASTAHIKKSLTVSQTQALLNEIPQAYHTQINDILLTALVQSFTKWSGESTLHFDLEGHGRDVHFEDIDISRTIGWFTSIFPVRLALKPETSLGDSLKLIKEQLRSIPNHGIGYGLLRYLNPKTATRLQNIPQAQVCFNYLGQFYQSSSSDILFKIAKEDSGPTHSPLEKRRYLIEINALVIEGQLQLDWTYSENIHERATIAQLAQYFIEALSNLIAHCQLPEAIGYTPSDFPLANLTQNELDQLTLQHGHNIESIYPLSHTQAGMLFHTLYAPKSSVYFEQLNCTLVGTLNTTAFQQAWQQVVERHAVLRSFFIWDDREQPIQIVCRSVNLPWQQHDWRAMTSTVQQERLETFLTSDRQESFILNQAPLMRCALIQLTENTYQFVWSHHHLLMDGWSLPIILKEVFAGYEAKYQSIEWHQDSPRAYHDYIAWLQQQNMATAESFWREKLQGFVAPTPLSVETAGSAGAKEKGALQQELKLPKPMTEALQTLAQQHHLTLNTLIQGAWALLLSRYSGEEDVVFGVTVSGRQIALAGVEAMVGLLINTLPVRVRISKDTALIAWLQQLQTQQVETEQYAYTPLVDIHRWSEVPDGTSLFDSILVFENYPLDDSLFKLNNLTISNVQTFEQTNYPLSIMGIPGPELALKIIYDATRFEAATMSRMLGHLQTLLEGMVANPEQDITELPLLTKAEQHQLLVEFNDTAADYPQDKCVHQLFEEQVDKTPDAIAVVFEEQQLTYQVLNERANQLAHHLQTLGIGPEVLVGICVERSLEMIIGLLGILKAGGAYVPLDPTCPQERLAFMLTDSNVPVLLTQQKFMDQLPSHQAQIVRLDTDKEVLSEACSANLVTPVQPDNLAYVIYTSGSTGKPKGVLIHHRNVLNLIFWHQQAFEIIASDRATQLANIAFDAQVWELWPYLTIGASLYLVEANLVNSPQHLQEWLLSNCITVSFLPTPLAEQMLTLEWPNNPALRILLTGGDQLHQYPPASLPFKVVNNYGPTENTVVTTSATVISDERQKISPVIGNPISNTQVYILDHNLKLVPIGVQGELHIGGIGLARNYLHRPELTTNKFVPNPYPFSNGFGSSRLYKTGDLARYLPDGNIEFLGRIDNQVKLRGFRIELGEIETLLNQHPNVQEAAVIMREDQPGDKRLVAYFVSDMVPKRIPYETECAVEFAGQTWNLRTEDISGNGVCLQHDEAMILEKDHKIRLRLQLPNEPEARWLQGKVVWSRDFWAGVEFMLTSDEQTILARNVEYLIEKSGILKIIQRLLVGNLRHYLEAKLPTYMVPSHFVLLSTLPLTPNGKVDRRAIDHRALIEPNSASDSELLKKEFMPQTELETLIAEVWQEVLQVNKVGIYDHFFEIGGHSLLIVQVQAKLQDKLGLEIPMVELFEHPTIHALAQHLSKKKGIPLVTQQIPEPTKKTQRIHQASGEIAIIGMTGRFPGANNIEEFWQNLRDGVESITFFEDSEVLSAGIDTTTLSQPNYVKAGGVLSDIEQFDASFFDMSPKEAEMMDPQQRLFLECAWEALETAGIEPGTNEYAIGVYAGVGANTYLLNNLYPNYQASDSVSNYQLMIGNGNDFLPTRVSYKLNLKGPSVNVQTACSTSLVAVHSACQSLLNDECDVALAGGVSLRVPHKTGYLYEEGMIYSPDGHCRAFDANAQGTVGGNGVGIVVLKRLEEAIADGDTIHAVIKGSAINNDGSAKVGYTAPSVKGQAEVIVEALDNAGIEAETIRYIETHGTGTQLGDPIEIAALKKAFQERTQKLEKGNCAIGSVKTNIGHTDTAAGVTGLIKTVLALKHQLLPPSLHFEHANPQIDFANSPFYVNTTLSKWSEIKGAPRRAGVSSFGIGGTNAHLILEEAPTVESSGESRPWQLLVLSAKTESALDIATANLASYLEQHPNINLADVAYTLSKGRQAFNHRQIFVCQNLEKAMTALRTTGHFVNVVDEAQERRNVVFMFSGQGTQYVNMGLELYQHEPRFRESVDFCAEYLTPHLGLDLRDVLYPEISPNPPLLKTSSISEATQKLNQTAITQPALFVIEFAMTQLWMSWGVYPNVMIGHSIGEYMAAYLASVFSLEDALMLVATRGQLMQDMLPGTMLAVPLSESEINPWLNNELSLAAINGPSRCVVSGPTQAIETLQQQLIEQGVECRHLQTSHAFHSEMMAPIMTSFTERIKQVKLSPPKIPYVSNVTGTWITAEQATNPSYWATHLRQTVRFSDSLQQILTKSESLLLEIGPAKTLTALVKQHPAKTTGQVVLSSLRHPQDKQSDRAFLLNNLGQVWLSGTQVSWAGFYANERRHRVPLPTYPFERQRCWIDAPNTHQLIKSEFLPETELAKKVELTPRHSRANGLQTTYVAPRNELEQTIADVWSQYLGIEQVGIHDNFFELGGDSLQAVPLVLQLQNALQVKLGLHHMIEVPTVAMLASVVEKLRISKQLSEQQTDSLLVEFQSGGSMLPLFCIHPAGGTVFPYVKLVNYLDSEQPIYGIQSPILNRKKTYSNLAERATHYIEVIKTVQPTGPYFLAGMSYGGNMAVEMAIQLKKQANDVALVVLFDSYPPMSYQNQSENDTSFLIAFASTMREVFGKTYTPPETLYDELQQLDGTQQWDYFIKRMNSHLPIPEMAPDEIHRFFKLWQGNHKELRHHLSQIYPGRITFFQANEKLPDDLKTLLNISVDDQMVVEGWDQLSLEPIEYFRVPGNHFTMLNEPHVQRIGRTLRDIIKKVQAGL
jgi:amino acid adenylation domain-containing protein/non-ribosomal peptide synthase protein (TIGR01720 family)